MNSTAKCMRADSPNVITHRTMGKPIKPPGGPLASDQIGSPSIASTGDELIVNKLESPDGEKYPDRQWAEDNKYTCYAARVFGIFNPAEGRWVYGIELRKALRRKAYTLKRILWDLEIMVPIANRIATGMARLRWGAEDGRTRLKEAIALGGFAP